MLHPQVSASLTRRPIQLVGEQMVICWISMPVGGASPLSIGIFGMVLTSSPYLVTFSPGVFHKDINIFQYIFQNLRVIVSA